MNNFKKTLFIAFLISLAIHYMLYFTIDKSLQNSTLQINTTNKKNTTTKNGLVKIQYVKMKQVKKKVKKTVPSKTVKVIKKQPSKKTKAQKITQKQEVMKKSTSIIQLPIVKKETLDLKQFFTLKQNEIEQRDQEIEKQQEIQEELEEIKKLPALTQSYIKLYGEQYFEFSENQRRYIKQNLNTIGKITQRYLEYPRISIRTKQKGMNVVKFYLHPNGDISELKITDSSHYTALDSNTIETIRIAYQDYPKPVEKVKIKIYVKYILY